MGRASGFREALGLAASCALRCFTRALLIVTSPRGPELLSILVEKPSSKSSEMSYAAAPSVAG